MTQISGNLSVFTALSRTHLDSERKETMALANRSWQPLYHQVNDMKIAIDKLEQADPERIAEATSGAILAYREGR